MKCVSTECSGFGKLFGNGLYFTDVASKAVSRCGATKLNPEAYLLLCHVNTGNEFKIGRSKIFKKAPVGYHSVKGCGRYAPVESEQITLDGSSGYSGAVEKNNEELDELKTKESSLNYNEYVVFDNG
jgi:poly [ADP-ribose] polymerase 1